MRDRLLIIAFCFLIVEFHSLVYLFQWRGTYFRLKLK